MYDKPVPSNVPPKTDNHEVTFWGDLSFGQVRLRQIKPWTAKNFASFFKPREKTPNFFAAVFQAVTEHMKKESISRSCPKIVQLFI